MTEELLYVAIKGHTSLFMQYGGNGLGKTVHHSIEALVEMRKTHGIVARVENSGCEGYYVEVARWSERNHRWEKFCFEKFLGGEIWDDDDAFVTAEKVCNLINGLSGAEESLIHTFPSWEGE